MDLRGARARYEKNHIRAEEIVLYANNLAANIIECCLIIQPPSTYFNRN